MANIEVAVMVKRKLTDGTPIDPVAVSAEITKLVTACLERLESGGIKTLAISVPRLPNALASIRVSLPESAMNALHAYAEGVGSTRVAELRVIVG